jgi:hypothetical protein
VKQHIASIRHVSPGSVVVTIAHTRWHHRLFDFLVWLMEVVCLCWLVHPFGHCAIAYFSPLTNVHGWLVDRASTTWESWDYYRDEWDECA